MDHHGGVLVSARSASGEWVRWRVGRRRLAWRPGSSVLEFLQFAEDPFTFVVAIPVLAWWLLLWSAALLATVVVWPARMASGRWPVVAYPLDTDDGGERRWVHGRRAADAAARQRAADIRRDGGLR